jgi:formylmethanofuran dehydrogenase subunit E-like metal-binding protein
VDQSFNTSTGFDDSSEDSYSLKRKVAGSSETSVNFSQKATMNVIKDLVCPGYEGSSTLRNVGKLLPEDNNEGN